jgi:hypothetical protein
MGSSEAVYRWKKLKQWQRSVFVSFVINHISLHNNTLFLQAPVFNREKKLFSEKFIHQINISNDDIIYDVYTCLISNSKEQHEDNLQRNCYTTTIVFQQRCDNRQMNYDITHIWTGKSNTVTFFFYIIGNPLQEVTKCYTPSFTKECKGQ